MPLLAQNAFRMELHPFQRQRTVTETHNFVRLAVITQRPGGQFKFSRETVRRYDQRVIARDRQRMIEAGKYATLVMLYRRGFTVHHPAGALYARAKCLGNGLMPEANTRIGS